MIIQLSIIIPVYKVEDYVKECLDSVFSQIPEGIEIIVVDDGSPDRSMDIIRHEFDEWIARGVLILLEQENKGPGGARNYGISSAQGKYIGFLDSDDVLLNGYFDELMDRIDLGVADIIEFGFKRFTDAALMETQQDVKLYAYSGLVGLTKVRDQVFARTCWFPSLRVFRRDVLEEFRFKEYTQYEDWISLPDIYTRDWYVDFIDRPLLGYRKRDASITSMHSIDQLSTLYDFYQSIPLNAKSEFKILKIRLARTLIYFYCELKPNDFPIIEIIIDCKQMQLSHESQTALLWPDWFLYKMPNSYMFINNLRFKILHNH
jgi:glycosyltransferase involved in cell wall biosynthesis